MMARRLLTRIELRMEDLQEYELMKKQQEKRRNGVDNLDNALSSSGRIEEQSFTNFKSNRELIYERIGYNPIPRNPT